MVEQHMKPPLGVVPRAIWLEHRIRELLRAAHQSWEDLDNRENPQLTRDQILAWLEEAGILLAELAEVKT